jgi:ribosome-binding protein aMBF1 (putative translation factor)
MKQSKKFQTAQPSLTDDWHKLNKLSGSPRSGLMNELSAKLKIERSAMSKIVHGHLRADYKVFVKIQAFINFKTNLFTK